VAEAEIIPPTSRPAEFTDEIFQDALDRMAGGQGLRKICEDPQMPSRQTFLRWIEKDTGRQTRYQAAREALMDWYAEEILEIAWDSSKDTIPAEGKKPARCDNEWVNRSRLKVDTLKFLMAKLHPKRYGDKAVEAEAERQLVEVRWQQNEATQQPRKIERVILEGGATASGPLQDRIAELEAQLAEARGEKPTEPPKLITYDPGPLPSRVDPEILIRMTELIKAKVPKADQRPPEEVLEEVLSVCGRALDAEYGQPPEIDSKSVWQAAG
jgi:terminase small subunit-like protein